MADHLQYQAFDYLEAGRDYRVFAFPPEVGRVPSTAPVLDDDQRRRRNALLRRATVVSLHDHPTRRPASPDDFRPYRKQGREVTGYEGLTSSPIDVVVDGMMAGAAFMTSASGWKWTDVVFDLGMRQCDIDHQHAVKVVRSLTDVALLEEQNATGLVFAIESAAPIENELDRLDILFGLGVRVVGLTYNAANALGSGLGEASDGGLTRFGHQAVRRMNQLGMVIDLSHTGDRTSLDVITSSSAPTMISHTGARALWDVARLKPDDVLRACATPGA